MKKRVSPRSLNRDDDKLLLKPEETIKSLNIDTDSNSQNEGGLVKSVAGNDKVPFSDGSMSLGSGNTNKVLGSVSDDQLGVIYYFVHNNQGNHFIAAYSSKTGTYRIVFQDPSLNFQENGFVSADVLRLRRVPEDQESIVYVPEPEAPPVINDPILMSFSMAVDFSVMAEYLGYNYADQGQTEYTAKLRFDSTGFYIGATREDLASEMQVQEFDCVISGNVYDGWVATVAGQMYLGENIWVEGSRSLKYQFVSTLSDDIDVVTDIPIDEVLSSADNTYDIINFTPGVDGAEPSDIRLYGKNHSISEATLDDLQYFDTKDTINASWSLDGLLVNRFVKVAAECKYSETEEWETFFLSQQYDGGLFEAGRFADDGEDPTGFGGGGGGGGGGDSTYYIYWCEGTAVESYNGFDVYPSFAAAMSQWNFLQNQGQTSIQVIELPNCIGDVVTSDFDGIPYIRQVDFKNGVETASPTVTTNVFDQAGPSMTEVYRFEIQARLSSCGTMRTKNGIHFCLNEDVETENEVLDFSESTGSYMYSTTYDDTEVSQEVSVEGYNDSLLGYRTFELGPWDFDGNFLASIGPHTGVVSFMSYDDGNPVTTPRPYCFESLTPCEVTLEITDTDKRVILPEIVENVLVDPVEPDIEPDSEQAPQTRTERDAEINKRIKQSKKNLRDGLSRE